MSFSSGPIGPSIAFSILAIESVRAPAGRTMELQVRPWSRVLKSCSSFFIEAPIVGNLDFDFLAINSVTRGGSAEAIPSELLARLGPCGVTSLLCKVASSELSNSAPPGCTFVTAVVPREGLNWCCARLVGSDMVVTFSSNAFAHDELLAKRLASHVAGVTTTSAAQFKGLSASCPAMVVAFACALAGSSVNPLRGGGSTEGNSSVKSRRTSYQFNSDTGCEIEVGKWLVGYIFEVIVTGPTCGDWGISKCM